MNNARVCGGRE